jgi:PBSX family phage terminase large subunit
LRILLHLQKCCVIMTKTQTINWGIFSAKHKAYIKRALQCDFNVAEGAIRSGKTIDHCIIAAAYLETCPDKIHLASGSTLPNAKLNIGDCNGFGLEHLFRGRCRWGKYKENEALYIQTKTGEKIILFSGGGKADSYKKILGNSYGMWIATEINEHYDSDDSRVSFVKVAMGRQVAAAQPFTLWDLNPSNPSHPIYENYIDRFKTEYAGQYQYEHFTIDDNATLTEERKASLKSKYVENSVWYRRDILGERCIAEGLVYQQFADFPDNFIIDTVPNDIIFATIGIDFGGNKSATTFCCTGFSRGLQKVIVLNEHKLSGINSPEKINEEFTDFCKQNTSKYRIENAYCDSAEQTLMQGMRVACFKEHIPLNIKDALKGEINDRIRFLNSMMGQNRFFIMRNCQNTIKSLRSAVWDNKSIVDKRLDNGTYDVDSEDALHYSFEKYMKEIQNARLIKQ